MILQSLVSYYECLAEQGLAERPGWGQAKVSFGLEISLEGEILGVVPLKQEIPKGKKTVLAPQILRVPEPVTRTVGISANFLCDHSGYILGVDAKGKPDRALQCFEAAKKKHLEVLEKCDSEPAVAVKAFFRHWNPELVKENVILQNDLEEILSGVNLIFLYRNRRVQDDSGVKQAWEAYRTSELEGSLELHPCLVTGKKAKISRVHSPIKGVPGAQTSGAALVSFNAPSFESYGKGQSYNAPVGEYAMYAYTTALNYLISKRKHRTLIGDTMIVYWAESGNEGCQNAFEFLMNPGPDTQNTVDSLFKKLKKGVAIDIEGVGQGISGEETFYILGIAPNAARLSVRFFYHDSFGNIVGHIKKHYERLEIIKPDWIPDYMGVWRMLQETVNQKSKDKKPIPNMSASVYRAVLSDERYPQSLYNAVMCRIRAEQGNQKITPGRAAIMKAYLIKNYKEDISVEINEDNQNIAYILGREFAVLEAIQESANPGINATIKDRYFNSACVTPAVIFPILFRLKNSHIRKVTNGQAVYYEKLLGSLQGKIEAPDGIENVFPKRLSLEEQGMFILGYYHQTQKRFEKKEREEI